MALHKTNIYIDISGWAPRHIPTEVVRELRGRLRDRFLFGSDYPFIRPERCLEDFFDRAADHARALAERLDHQEQSVERFLELSEDDDPQP